MNGDKLWEKKGLKKLLRIIKDFQQEIKNEKLERKNKIIHLITKPWSEAEIKDYNLDLIANSAGWLGGNYDEQNCKKSILRDNANLFTKEEYESLSDTIYPSKIK